MAPSSTISVSLIPLDFEEKGIYASYTQLAQAGYSMEAAAITPYQE